MNDRANRPTDLFVFGDVNPDVVVDARAIERTEGQVEHAANVDFVIGGSCLITACGAARLGLEVAVAGAVGDDRVSGLLLDQLRTAGFDTSRIERRSDVATGISVVVVHADDHRTTYTDSGAISLSNPNRVTDADLRRVRHLHLASLFLLDAGAEEMSDLLRRAKRAGATTSIDTNWDSTGTWELSDLLEHCDIFFPNEDEALLLTGAPDVEHALTALASKVDTVVLKRGAHGAIAESNGIRYAAPAIDVTPVDTVGAGDSCNAGFLYGYLNGWDPQRALHCAMITGGLSTRGAGGTATQPNREEMRSLL